MKSQKSAAEEALHVVRQTLASAASAIEVKAAGSAIPDLINKIEVDMDRLADAIAEEAESLDRKKANGLRSERNSLSDLLTDAEDLGRRIDTKYKMILEQETSTAMIAKRTDAERSQVEAQSIVAGMETPLQLIVEAAEKYASLSAKIQAINNELRAGNCHELCVRPPLHVLVQRDENLANVFDFLYGGNLLAPGVEGPNLLHVARRMKALLSTKGS